MLLRLGRMKALQKNQGRTDQMLGAMADVLTSVAMPSHQGVSRGSYCVFAGCLEAWYQRVKEKARTGVFFRGCRS